MTRAEVLLEARTVSDEIAALARSTHRAPILRTSLGDKIQKLRRDLRYVASVLKAERPLDAVDVAFARHLLDEAAADLFWIERGGPVMSFRMSRFIDREEAIAGYGPSA